MRVPVILALMMIALVAACGGKDDVAARKTLQIAVAANFIDCATGLAREFERIEGCEVVLISGSTGRLAKQIEEGAPFAVFLAADVERPAKLAAADRVDPASLFTYARGLLALAVPEGRAPPTEIDGSTFRSGARLAIARPELAPYGRAAEELIAEVGSQSELVYGENVAQVVHYVATAAVDFGLVPLSLARSRGLPHLEIAASRHQPIEQQAALVDRDSEVGRRFLAFLKGDRARRLISESGYLPG